MNFVQLVENLPNTKDFMITGTTSRSVVCVDIPNNNRLCGKWNVSEGIHI